MTTLQEAKAAAEIVSRLRIRPIWSDVGDLGAWKAVDQMCKYLLSLPSEDDSAPSTTSFGTLGGR